MKIEIISEIGINHNGDMELAKKMIWLSKAAGADMAKFQIYDPMLVLGPDDPDMLAHKETILKTELTKEQVVMLKEECDKAEIEFFASVFRPEVIGWTEAIGMKRYKIASRSIYDTKLAEAIIKTEKPVIISYGYAKPGKEPEIVRLAGMCQRFRHLYCISVPAPLKDMHFFTEYNKNRLSIFAQPYGYDGFSHHSQGIIASVTAMVLGARIIEQHFTLDRNLPGPDQSFSINPEELQQLCHMRDKIEILVK